MTGERLLGHILENNERAIHLNFFGITADFFCPRLSSFISPKFSHFPGFDIRSVLCVWAVRTST